MKLATRYAMVATILATIAAPAAADKISVVGSWSSLPLHSVFEVKFWGTTLPEASGGALSVTINSFDQMGLRGADVFPLLRDGVSDFGISVGDHTAADAPEIEALDVPLIAMTVEDARRMVDAGRDMVASIMERRFRAKLLAIAPYPPQVVFCRGEVGSLADLQGKRVRGSGSMTTQLLTALGAQGVNIAFGETPGALERGVVDCAVTGVGTGYSAGWYEMTDSVLMFPIGGWDPVITAVSLDSWNRLSPQNRELIETMLRDEFEPMVWDFAASSLETDVACLSGGECPHGEPANLVVVQATNEDIEVARAALIETVLPSWAGRVGNEWIAQWNDSIGATFEMSIGN
jgi:TRAP-type C4-dicarboxylate transport system substrate-binding protein